AEGTKLKEEYLKAVFLQGTVVSFPVGVDAEGTEWQRRPLAEAVAAMERTATAFEYVEVLNSNVATRKLALTARARAIKNMVVPVAVQRMSAWRQATEATGGVVVEVFEDGAPETRDALHLASWPVLRGALRRWSTVATADVAGCHSISAPVLLATRDWGRGEDVPTVVVLDHLVATGWTRSATPTPAHDRATEKKFFAPNLLRAKSFLQCLCALEQLLERGLTELPVAQPPLFYRCLLEAECPGVVPVGQTREVYLRLRSEATAPSALAIEDAGEEDVIVGSGGSAAVAALRCLRRRGSAARTGHWTSTSRRSAGAHWRRGGGTPRSRALGTPGRARRPVSPRRPHHRRRSHVVRSQ
ncbi:MAG: hypothetical protein GY772_19300, partial [bacterium]|nr:hypothetical protein [bacterium]